MNSKTVPWPKSWQPPLVVKPVRQGSSVGLQFVEQVGNWQPALAEALKHDSEVLVEEKIAGRETTVGILGGEPLPIVEVRPKTGGYDYKNKYTAGPRNIFVRRNLMRRRRNGFKMRRWARLGGGRTRLCAGGCNGASGR